MEILNIGIPELVFIFLIMLIFLGPEGFSQTARGLARMIRRLIHSPIWNDVVKTQREIQELPTRLVREAGIDDIQQEVTRLSQQTRADLNSIRQPVPYGQAAAAEPQTPVESAETESEAGDYDYRAAALGAPEESIDTLDTGEHHRQPVDPDTPQNPGQETP